MYLIQWLGDKQTDFIISYRAYIVNKSRVCNPIPFTFTHLWPKTITFFQFCRLFNMNKYEQVRRNN